MPNRRPAAGPIQPARPVSGEGDGTLSLLKVCRLAPVALLALAVGGCSGSGPSSFAFGKSPPPPVIDPNLFPAKYREEIADFMRTWLSNPTKVKDAFIAQPTLRPVAGTQHYISCVRYNARGTSNQYEGPKQNVAIFLGGRLNQFLPDDQALCSGLAYQRYPELEALVP